MVAVVSGFNFGAGHGVRRRRHWLRAALFSTVSLYAVAAHAQNATWTGASSSEWQDDTNWTAPSTVPTGTAFFDTSANTTVQNDLGIVSIGAISFLNTASAYTININNPFFITGGGVTNSSASTQTVEVDPISNGGQLIFQNSATANAGVGSVTYNNHSFIVFQNTSNAGNSATTINNSSILQFFDSSTGGSAHINNNATTDFFDSSSAASATITNGNGAALSFNNTSTAGSATINTTLSSFATITFNNSSTAGTSHIDLIDGILTFNDSSKAGASTITMSSLTHPGSITFNNTSSAENATITNVSITGLGNGVRFLDQSTAGNATINNNTNNSIPGSGGELYFGTLGGTDTANAGTAHITNNNQGSTSFLAQTSAANATIVNNSGGSTNFQDQSTAANATITNNSSGSLSFVNQATAGNAQITNSGSMSFGLGLGLGDTATAGSSTITNNGFIFFNDSTKAGTATITSNPGSISFLDSSSAENANITTGSGGLLSFADTSTAGSATINTNAGGRTQFTGNSDGGSAQFVTNGTGQVDFSGTTGTLSNNKITAGSIAGSGTYFLGGNQLRVGSNNLSTEVSGIIADGGTFGGTGGELIKIGTGTLTLSGVSTNTGGVSVQGGTLVMNGSVTGNVGIVAATLTGTGTVGGNVVMNPGATFRPGDGTAGSSMHVNGNLFPAGGVYAVNINPTTSSFALVDGTATGGGTKVDATFATGGYIAKQYTILTALGGVQANLFSGGLVNHNLPAGFIDSLSYDATHAYLNLAFAPPTVPGGGLSNNQQNVFNGINNSFNTVGQVPIAFGALSAAHLTQLSGEVGAGFSTVAFQAGNSFLNLMLNPFVDGRFGGTGGASGYAEEKRPHAAEAAFASAMPSKAAKVASFDDRISIWGAAFGATGAVKGDPTAGSHRTSDQYYGFAAGLDYKLTPNTLVGFALAGGGTHWGLDSGLGSGRSDMFQAGVYGITHLGAAYLSAAAAYSFHDVRTTRTVTAVGTDALAASFRANMVSGRLEGGYRAAFPWFAVTPYGAVQVQSIALPSYGESATSGSNQFALNYSSQTVTTTRVELGGRFDKTWLLAGGQSFTLHGRAAWAHDWGNTTTATALFQALPFSTFSINGARPAADGALVSAGGEYKMGNGWSVLAKFDGEFSSTTALYAGSGAIKKVW